MMANSLLEGKAQEALAWSLGDAAYIVAGIFDCFADSVFIDLLLCNDNSFLFAVGRRNFFNFHNFTNCVIHVTLTHASGHAGDFYSIFEHFTNDLSYLFSSAGQIKTLAPANLNISTNPTKRQEQHGHKLSDWKYNDAEKENCGIILSTEESEVQEKSFQGGMIHDRILLRNRQQQILCADDGRQIAGRGCGRRKNDPGRENSKARF